MRLARALAVFALVVPLLIEATAQRVVAAPSMVDEVMIATDGAPQLAFRHCELRPDLLARVVAPLRTILTSRLPEPSFRPTKGRDPTGPPVSRRAGTQLIAQLPRPPGSPSTY